MPADALRVTERARPVWSGPVGLPARLRRFLPLWRRLPEPKVRYGQICLPGLSCLEAQHALEAEAYLESALALRGGRFAFNGQVKEFRGRIDWNPRDCSEGWRVRHASLDGLFALGIAAAVAPTLDERHDWYAVAAALIREWIRGARPGRGVAWAGAALSRRIPNLIHAYAFFAPELRQDAETRRTLLESLYLQANALASVATDPPQGWSIAAGRALFLAGRFFDGLEARPWLEHGAALLWRELRDQFHEDGGHFDRHLGRQVEALRDYLEVLALLRASNDDVPTWARKRVKAMADCLARVLHPGDGLPGFHGAGSEGPSPREVLATAAVVLHEPALASEGELPGVWPLVIIGDTGRRVHASLPRRRAPIESRALRRTGYYVLAGEPGDVMLLDGGLPPSAGYASICGYELSVGGERLVVSPGPAGEDASWNGFARSATAQNVAVVDGEEPVRWGSSGEANGAGLGDVRWVVRDGLVYFAGALATVTGRRQRRHVFCLPGCFWIVCDEVLGMGSAAIESFAHLHPDSQLRAWCNGRTVLTVARSSTSWAQMLTAGADEVRILSGQNDGRLQGWHAPTVGIRVPAPVVSVAATGALPLAVAYAFLPRVDLESSLTLQHDTFELSLAVRIANRAHLIRVVQDEVELEIRTV